MIMGFASSVASWGVLLDSLVSATDCLKGTLDVCVFDNRGVGRSSVPLSWKEYSTEIMAEDTHALMVRASAAGRRKGAGCRGCAMHAVSSASPLCVSRARPLLLPRPLFRAQESLGWDSAHVVGFSMGGMVATKLASAHPQSVRSLTLISVSGGGLQIIPLSAKAFRNVVRGAVSKERLPEATVKLLFSQNTRRKAVGAQQLGDLLVEEYQQNAATQWPRKEGEAGHLSACWSHEMTQWDVDRIREAGFPVAVIHGRHDLLAMPRYAERLAERLGARMVLVDGGHFVPRECAAEVSQQLVATVLTSPLEGRCDSPPHRSASSSPERATPSSAPSRGASVTAASASPSPSHPEGSLGSTSSQLTWPSSRPSTAGARLKCRAAALMGRAHSFIKRLRT